MTSYELRLNRVLEHIDNNLENTISVAELSALACFSKFHFHRIFVAMVGMSAGKYIRLMRFKKVSYQLACRTHLSITDIAVNAGFDSASSFSREFKNTLGLSPSAFRKKPDWLYWQQVFEPMYAPIEKYLIQQNEHDMQNIEKINDVKIVDFPQTPVAVKEHIGPPNLVMQSVVSHYSMAQDTRRITEQKCNV